MRTSAQRGQALMETILLGLVLLAPLIWALGVLADLQRASLAATNAVRDAGFEAAAASDATVAARRMDTAVKRSFVNHGLDPSLARLKTSFKAGLRRGAELALEVRYPVSVIAAPFLGRIAGPSVWVRAVHVTRVPLYGSRR